MYEEISSPGKTFYTWSNDNGVYTELGGVVEGQVSYSVIFATDRSPQGRVLDNRHAVEGSADDPRDLAMLRIIKNFEKAPGGSEVSDAILAGIPEGSQSETGGFYDFGGQWVRQRITGVIWLTHFKKGDAAHAPQPLRLRDGTILILWEKTGAGGPAIFGTRVAESGSIISQSACPRDWQFNRGDRSIALGDRIFLLATDRASGRDAPLFRLRCPRSSPIRQAASRRDAPGELNDLARSWEGKGDRHLFSAHNGPKNEPVPGLDPRCHGVRSHPDLGLAAGALLPPCRVTGVFHRSVGPLEMTAYLQPSPLHALLASLKVPETSSDQPGR